MTRFRKGEYVICTHMADDIYINSNYTPKVLNRRSRAYRGFILKVIRSYPRSFWGSMCYQIMPLIENYNIPHISIGDTIIGMPYKAFKKINEAEVIAMML